MESGCESGAPPQCHLLKKKKKSIWPPNVVVSRTPMASHSPVVPSVATSGDSWWSLQDEQSASIAWGRPSSLGRTVRGRYNRRARTGKSSLRQVEGMTLICYRHLIRLFSDRNVGESFNLFIWRRKSFITFLSSNCFQKYYYFVR